VKLIVAMIRSDRVQAVQEALKEPDAYVLYTSSAGDIRECLTGTYRGSDYREPRPRVRLEVVVVNDLVVQDTIDVITQVACAPNPERISNGSIFVMPLEEWVRIPADQPRPTPNPDERIYSAREAS
jgi:nitrogen regulatory protein PII